jgi:flagellar motor switch protein FliN/FliY
MPIGDLLALSAGTVLELDRRVGEPVDIFVNDRLIARGEVVLIDNALGVTLTEIVRPDR